MIKQETRDKFDIPQHAVLFALIYRAAVELYGRQGAQRRITAQRFTAINAVCVWLKGR